LTELKKNYGFRLGTLATAFPFHGWVILKAEGMTAGPHRLGYITALCVVDARGCAVEFRLWRLGTHAETAQLK